MCGVVAVRMRAGPLPPGALERATAALRHRGPDDERTWCSADGRVGLGHTRLSIIDPDGVQPIANEDGSVRIVVNGEFYGFEEIRRRLEAKGHRFRTRSDSEVALHLYEEHGAGCLEHLRGEFAFVVWDARRGRIFAARDRFGIKPLFYARDARGLFLASEAKALFAAGVACAWDPRAVYHTVHACPDESASLFDGVAHLPPGHHLVAGEDCAPHLTRYWDLATAASAGKGTSRARPDAVAAVRAHLDEAVRVRMRVALRIRAGSPTRWGTPRPSSTTPTGPRVTCWHGGGGCAPLAAPACSPGRVPTRPSSATSSRWPRPAWGAAHPCGCSGASCGASSTPRPPAGPGWRPPLRAWPGSPAC